MADKLIKGSLKRAKLKQHLKDFQAA